MEILGATQAEQWTQITGPLLKNRYAYRVEFVDQREAEQEAMQALQLYTMMSQDPGVDPVGLREYLINRVNNPSFTRIFNQNILAEILKRKIQGVDAQPMKQLPNNGGGNAAV